MRGLEFIIIAMRIKSDRLRACSFSIMWARCNSTVRKLMPRRRAMTLLGSPAATRSKTSRSRGVSEAARICKLARSRRSSSFQCNARSMLSSRASSRNGFSMKSKAPAFIAAIASETVPWPVMNITGIRQPRTLSCCCSSSPVIWGIRTSSKRQPPRRGSKPSRNERADGNASTEYPAVRSINLSPCLTAASSSTTNTALSGIAARFRLHCWQIEDKGRPGMSAANHSEAATMRFDYRAADREPHSHAERLGRDERLEYGVRHLGGDPGSGIDHGDLDGLFAVVPDLDDDRSSRAVRRFHRIHRVAEQVQQHLLNLNSVGQNDCTAGIDLQIGR